MVDSDTLNFVRRSYVARSLLCAFQAVISFLFKPSRRKIASPCSLKSGGGWSG